MPVDLQSLRSQLLTHHNAVVGRYLDHFGLTELPEFTFADPDEVFVDAWHPGSVLDSDGFSHEVYTERPIEATRSDLLTALQNFALFSAPVAEDTPAKATSRARSRKAKKEEAADESDDDAAPNS